MPGTPTVAPSPGSATTHLPLVTGGAAVTRKADLLTSLVVFLVALPLCAGAPSVLSAGLLVHAGCRLVPVRESGPLWREHRGELVVLVVTASAITAGNLFEGVTVGLALAVAKTAWDVSQV